MFYLLEYAVLSARMVGVVVYVPGLKPWADLCRGPRVKTLG